MDRQLLMDICDKIDQDVTDIKYTDIDFGQLSTQARPAVAFPCCLVDTTYGKCEDATGEDQQVTATISVRLAFLAFGVTHAGSTDRTAALTAFDTIKKVHKALQGWDNDGAFDPLTRMSATTEKRNDGLRVFRITYQASFIDKFE